MGSQCICVQALLFNSCRKTANIAWLSDQIRLDRMIVGPNTFRSHRDGVWWIVMDRDQFTFLSLKYRHLSEKPWWTVMTVIGTWSIDFQVNRTIYYKMSFHSHFFWLKGYPQPLPIHSRQLPVSPVESWTRLKQLCSRPGKPHAWGMGEATLQVCAWTWVIVIIIIVL
jgi:hypothetical protein